jgi:hypothetical protein
MVSLSEVCPVQLLSLRFLTDLFLVGNEIVSLAVRSRTKPETHESTGPIFRRTEI